MFAERWIATRRHSVIFCAVLAAGVLAGPVDAGPLIIGGAQNKNVVGGSATLAPGVGGAVKKNTKGTVVDATGPDKKVVPGPLNSTMKVPEGQITAIPQPPKGDVATCQQYASQAMAAISQAMMFNCQGVLIGPRWSGDYNAHFNWCMTGVSKAVRDSETMARNAAIQTCIASNRK